MRLKSIKLAGFKSFVDPTTVPFPSQLVAVVGPNGCGKSNIIDAVRWVMGESSAKQLRGDSMASVIFNGSSTRKPLGQASVELHFDNTDGKLGGAYAQYNEIVIRRMVTQDGQSSYYLNGTHCRRRDITDIFLGTGLGPRSYAIIEQGTISRLIEAKPDELRVYLEEAAGISKYKERRRETELRMQHTRDNLARLEDIRGELTKQIEHLQRQATTAERYQTLKDQERILKAQLLFLRWQAAGQQLHNQEHTISQLEVQLEAANAELQHLNTHRETLHVNQNESYQEVQAVQQRYYQLNTELARLEQTIQHQRERHQQLQNEYQQAESAHREAQEQLIQENDRAEQLSQQIIELEPQVTTATANTESARNTLHNAEEQMHQWQTRWDEFNQQAASAAQIAQVEQTHIQHIEQRLQNIQQRINRLHSEQQQHSDEIPEAIRLLEEQDLEISQEIQTLQNQMQEMHMRLNTQRDNNNHQSQQLDKTRSELQTLKGRFASLSALQEAALGKSSGVVVGWLQNQQLQNCPRLAQSIQVENGWEKAVETVLGDHLEAICIDGMNKVLDALDQLTHGTLTVVDTHATEFNVIENPLSSTIISKVSAPWQLNGLLDGIFTADTLEQAVALLPYINAQQSIITPDGIWLGHGWLRIARDADEKSGVLQRERELTDLQKTIDLAAHLAEEIHQRLEDGQLHLITLEDQRDELQRSLGQKASTQADIKAQCRIQHAQLQQQQQRASHLAQELGELQEQFAVDQEELATARTTWQNALTAMEKDAQLRDEFIKKRDIYRETLDNARQNARALQDQSHQLSVQLQILQTQNQSAQQLQIRLQQQLTQTQERQEYLAEQLQNAQAPQTELEQQLNELLNARQLVEQELRIAREQFEEIEQESRECEKKRHESDQRTVLIRNNLEHERISRQTLEVRQTTLQEQLAETGVTSEEIQANLTDDLNETNCEEQLNKTQQRIERLGPINLAAISEYATQSERKNYLDAQHEDLMTALTTLETAIRKIDHETRERFKEVYDQVNNGFQTLFPRVFGGGQAYLELVGEDLLDTGVNVIARPPGKRNSTIHLLSGGEKALTAVALVFAIFQLNPAPFCMLDEVDAPLDDANIGRFCELVKEMSKTIQFIFISHNKLAMEMADHLTGVTMHEPGVSRLVAVDVNAAVEMAAA